LGSVVNMYDLYSTRGAFNICFVSISIAIRNITINMLNLYI
jgi:hypothetical protein